MAQTAIAIPCGEFTLEGELITPEGSERPPAVVVCHPHPQMGGDMYNSVVATVCDAVVERGYAALRFNFRGTGGSGGAHSGGGDEPDDVRAALAHARSLPEIDGARLGLAGYSFGAAMAAAAADGSLAAVALVSVPLGMAGDLGARLGALGRPLLLIAGDQDRFCPTDTLEQLATALGDYAEAQIVAGADHFWSGHEGELGRSVGEFFAAHL